MSHPTIIAFASPKGGVGKSTMCASIAGALAHRGHPVRILDLDQNRTLYQWAQRFPELAPDILVEALDETAANLNQAFFDRIQHLYHTTSGYLLIDVAGALSHITIAAATVAHVTITPAKLSAPDIIEAVKLNREMLVLGEKIGKPVLHRLLLNEVSPLWPTYQRAALADVERSGLVRFETIIHERAPYAELFLTGQPPSKADISREPVAKAVAQLDALLDEILQLTTPHTFEEAA